MSTALPLVSATVLGKRKAVRDSASLVLHLASSPDPCHTQSDSDFEPQSSPGPASKPHLPRPIIVNGELVSSTAKRYKCTHAGCTKAYTKPSRLEEHERSHTGEVGNLQWPLISQLIAYLQRPFLCETCNKSYLRETHLHAHARSHLPESARPFGCPESNCEKRFWTTQHLRVHEDMHKGARPYQVNPAPYLFYDGMTIEGGDSAQKVPAMRRSQSITNCERTFALPMLLLAPSHIVAIMKGAPSHSRPTKNCGHIRKCTTVNDDLIKIAE